MAEVKAHGVLFKADMVRALLRKQNPKTQTRRLPNCRNCLVDGSYWSGKRFAGLDFTDPGIFVDPGPSPAGNLGPYLNNVPHREDGTTHRIYPSWQPNDLLWIKETWFDCEPVASFPMFAGRPRYLYRADGATIGCHKWCSAMLMPRIASRVSLTVKRIRIERPQQITYEDALAEGVFDSASWLRKVEGLNDHDETPEQCARRLMWPQREFALLWERINGAGSWDANPFVFVTEFRRTKP